MTADTTPTPDALWSHDAPNDPTPGALWSHNAQEGEGAGEGEGEGTGAGASWSHDAGARVGGVALRVAGDGEPVLFLHGIGGSSASFAPQFDGPLADRYRLIAWDAPGYGGSDDPPSGLDDTATLDHLADTAAAVIDACGGYAAVVGVSWGGVIATRLALRHPGAVRALVLADSSRGSGRTPAGRSGMRRRGQELAAVGAGTFAALRGPRLVAPGADRAVADRIVQIMSGIRPAGHAFAAASMAGADHSRSLADVTVPTLVVVGQHDQVTGVPESLALAEGIPGARFALVCGAGHAANQERPARFDALVGRFLADVGSGNTRIGATSGPRAGTGRDEEVAR